MGCRARFSRSPAVQERDWGIRGAGGDYAFGPEAFPHNSFELATSRAVANDCHFLDPNLRGEKDTQQVAHRARVSLEQTSGPPGDFRRVLVGDAAVG